RLQPGVSITVDGEGGPITALPVFQEHGDISSLGFRFGRLAYSCDLSGLPEASVVALAGLEVWIVDALRYRPHPSHFSVDDALAWIARIKPGRAILTNLHADLDYAELRSKLPPHVEPAFDGLKLVMPDAALASTKSSCLRNLFFFPIPGTLFFDKKIFSKFSLMPFPPRPPGSRAANLCPHQISPPLLPPPFYRIAARS